MKARLICTSLAFLTALPGAYGASELDTLRERCARQEQEIRRLEQLVRTLGGAPGQPSAAAAQSSSAQGSADAYIVRRGDSLDRIARRHGCSVAALARANGIKAGKVIHPGQKLRLPGAPKPSAKSTASAVNQGQSASATPPAGPAGKGYTVKPGDTLARIAKKHRIPLNELMAANPDVRPERLRPGQVIRLSADTTPAPVTASRPATSQPSTKPSSPAAAPAASIAASRTPVPGTPAPTPAPPPAQAAVPAPVATSNPGQSATPSGPAPAAPAAAIPSTPPPATTPPAPATAAGNSAGSPTEPATKTEKRIRSVTIDNEMTYGEFAAKHGTSTERLNELNGLDLNTSTVLAKGSELYVPAEP